MIRKRRLDRLVKPFALEQCGYPINQAIDYAGAYAIDDQRVGNGEHLRADAQDKSCVLLVFKQDAGELKSK